MISNFFIKKKNMFLIIMTSFLIIFGIVPDNIGNAQSNRQETYKQLNLFGDVFQRVQEQYVEEVTDKELIEAAISGMLQSLDPHSSYLSDESYKDMQVKTIG
jgi:carboxyl-terminal processing protease